MSRTQDAYVTLFSYIKQLAPNLEPQRIHCDFERAQMNAWRISFARSDIVGCLWHYGVVSVFMYVCLLTLFKVKLIIIIAH